MDTPPVLPSYPLAEPPKRHGCLTAWLVFMIVVNSLTALATPFTISMMQRAGYHLSTPVIGLMVVLALFNIACAVALLRWQKWGFYGFLATTVVALGLNLSLGIGIGQSLLGVVGIGILYWVLNMGGPNKAWPRLR